jgi:small subunit ribosomal protein S18
MSETPTAPEVPEGIRAKRPARRKRRARDRFFSRRKVSRLTADPGLVVDYKNVSLLKTFLSPEGKILPRRITGNTAKQQRQVALAIKRARHIALLSYKPFET